MIRVLLVDDHVMVRAGLAALLAAFDDLELAGEAPDGEAALLAYERFRPDVVLMDLMMPHMDGIEAVRRLRARYANVRAIMLTSYGGENHVQTAIEAGAMGFLLKNATAEELARAIRTAFRGNRVLAPEATDALVQSMRHDPAPGDDLTSREREVLQLIVSGYNNTEIAEKLFLSVSTVKFHVSAILSKLGVSNRIEAVALAIQNGLVKRA